MVRLKVPAPQKLSEPVYVLLTPSEKKAVDRLARDKQLSRGAFMRTIFRDWMLKNSPQKEGRR